MDWGTDRRRVDESPPYIYNRCISGRKLDDKYKRYLYQFDYVIRRWTFSCDENRNESYYPFNLHLSTYHREMAIFCGCYYEQLNNIKFRHEPDSKIQLRRENFKSQIYLKILVYPVRCSVFSWSISSLSVEHIRSSFSPISFILVLFLAMGRPKNPTI